MHPEQHTELDNLITMQHNLRTSAKGVTTPTTSTPPSQTLQAFEGRRAAASHSRNYRTGSCSIHRGSGVWARCMQLLMHLLACCPQCRHIFDANLPGATVPHIRLLGLENFNLWSTTWICGIQRWGRGCCHPDEIECKWKGIRRSQTFPRSSRSRELDQGYIADHRIRTLGLSTLCAQVHEVLLRSIPAFTIWHR